jgi:hypothetical protein
MKADPAANQQQSPCPRSSKNYRVGLPVRNETPPYLQPDPGSLIHMNRFTPHPVAPLDQAPRRRRSVDVEGLA